MNFPFIISTPLCCWWMMRSDVPCLTSVVSLTDDRQLILLSRATQKRPNETQKRRNQQEKHKEVSERNVLLLLPSPFSFPFSFRFLLLGAIFSGSSRGKSNWRRAGRVSFLDDDDGSLLFFSLYLLFFVVGSSSSLTSLLGEEGRKLLPGAREKTVW